MNTTPENAEAKYSTLGGYVKDYDGTLSTQKYQVPVAPDDDGVMQPITGGGNNYQTIQRTKFLEGTAGQPNAGFRYTTKGAAALSDKFNNGAEVHFKFRYIGFVALHDANKCCLPIRTTTSCCTR